jgi:cytoskeletal protein RodZ
MTPTKSVGNILATARQKKKFTLDDVHKFLKIHPKFLQALEDGDYSVFSDKIHAKGFLKVYAEFLELNVDEILGLWRREYETYFDKKIKENRRFAVAEFNPPKLLITPGLVLSVVFGILLLGFFGYLFYQYRNYSGAPRLEIFSPAGSVAVTSDLLDVTGKTDPDSVLLINNQRVILGPDGNFATTIRLKPGLNTLSFLAVNKLGRETEEIRTIIYREPEKPPEAQETTESTPSEQ